MLNKIQLIGFITHDLKKEYIKIVDFKRGDFEEVPKVNFQLAVNSSKDKEKNQPLFINCAVFRKQAENLFNFLGKGSKIYVEGRLIIQKYINKDNQEKTSINVNIQNIIYLDNKVQDDE